VARRSLLGFLVLGTVFGSACAKEIVVHDQDERNANHILHVLFVDEQIVAEKVRDEESRDPKYNILVAKDDKQKSLLVLERHNLPENLRDGLAKMIGSGMIPTNSDERNKKEVGIAGDIVNNLRKVPGIIDAAAFVSIPEDNPLRDPNEAKPKPKVSVMVIFMPQGVDGPPPMNVEEVQRLVQAALPEMTSKEVAVQLVPSKEGSSKRAAGPGETGGGAPIGANACEKDKMLGVELCAESRPKFLNILIAAAGIAALLAAATVMMTLRSMKYRSDLTRLTAQVAQLRK
jgi:type III secretory pathway lipoprotein EscJ